MLKSGEKLGAFIIPTGVGAAIGGFAGDASCYAAKFAKISKLIVNPNVVNAGCFSGIKENMFYVEGFSVDEFFKGNINLIPSQHNKIGVVFDKAIPEDVLNVHINTVRAVNCVYGVDIPHCEITDEEIGVEFKMEDSGISTGSVKNVETMLEAAKKLLEKGCNAIALVCLFDNPEEDNTDYANGVGTDPVGGIEAVLSHYISKELRVPCAHSPAFIDYQIYPDLVSGKAASEYITPTFLPCILLGLNNAPLITLSGVGSVGYQSLNPLPLRENLLTSHCHSEHNIQSSFANAQDDRCEESLNNEKSLSINNLDYLVMPYNSLGSTPVFEALKREIPVYAVKENTTALNVSPEKISDKIIVVETYDECLDRIITN